jgi:hypothetical protein
MMVGSKIAFEDLVFAQHPHAVAENPVNILKRQLSSSDRQIT